MVELCARLLSLRERKMSLEFVNNDGSIHASVERDIALFVHIAGLRRPEPLASYEKDDLSGFRGTTRWDNVNLTYYADYTGGFAIGINGREIFPPTFFMEISADDPYPFLKAAADVFAFRMNTAYYKAFEPRDIRDQTEHSIDLFCRDANGKNGICLLAEILGQRPLSFIGRVDYVSGIKPYCADVKYNINGGFVTIKSPVNNPVKCYTLALDEIVRQ